MVVLIVGKFFVVVVKIIGWMVIKDIGYYLMWIVLFDWLIFFI